MPTDRTLSIPARQHGMVLVVGLLLLLVLTLLGVTAMKSSTLQERIAANDQHRTAAFQAAEFGLARAATYRAVRRCLQQDCRAGVTVLDEDLPAGAGGQPGGAHVRVRMTEVGYLPAAGFSQGLGGGGVVRLRAFDLEATATVAGTHARAVHRMRIGRLVPAQ